MAKFIVELSEDQRAVLVSGRIPDIDASRLLPTVDELDKRLDAVRAYLRLEK